MQFVKKIHQLLRHLDWNASNPRKITIISGMFRNLEELNMSRSSM